MTTTYNVYRDEEKIATGLTVATYVDTGLTPNKAYTYQVSSHNSVGESVLSDPITVTTKHSPVENVSLNKEDLALETGEAEKLSVAVTPNTAKQGVEWFSDDESVATVDNNGNVEAAGEGETTVTARSTEDIEKEDICVVTVTEPKPEPEITTEEVTEEIDIVEYGTTRNETDSLPKGEEEVTQEGKNGYTKVIYKVTYEDGVEVNREEISREVVDPVDEIINVGTFEEPEVAVETETENIDTVKFETVRNETEELPKGEEKIVQEGQDGYTKVTYEVTYEDGKEVKREEKNRETVDPVDEIINVGTFEEVEPEPEG